ncbi:hypothetical protein QU41_12860 [Bradyrhizobium elkanii]|nr:hypothetical protein QU41_12860 [Bradyrhizobium elkanii]
MEGAGFAENSRSDGFLAADDFHRFVTDNDSADQRAQIRLARGRFAIIEEIGHEIAERSNLFRVNAGRWQRLRCCVVIGRLSLLAVGFEFDDSLAKKIVEFDDALLDSAIEPLEAIFGIDDLGFQRSEAAINGGGAFPAPGGNRGEQFGQTLGREHVLLERRQNQIIQESHPDRVPPTGRWSLLRTAGAGVIGVDAPRAGGSGPLRHPPAAMSTFGKSGQKDRTSDHTRGCDLGIIGHEAGLDAIEQVLLDNGGSCDLDDFRGGFTFARPGGPNIVTPAANIDGVGQDMVRGTDAKGPARLGPITTSVEPFDQLLDAERWGAGPGVTFRVEAKDEPDGLGLDGLDGQVLLDFLPPPLGFDNGVTERS